MTGGVRSGGEGTVTSASTDGVDESLKTRAMDEAPVGITVADASRPDMPLVYANAAFERITGYPPAYAVGRNCRFLQGEATRDAPVARMRAAIESDEATTVELRNYRRDGELFWNEVTIAPLRDEAGEVTHYVGFQQDVTRRKRAERAAARRAARIERERAAQELLLERLDGVVADVTGAVAEARSREQLERAVVEGLATTYDGAWIGPYDPADEAVVPGDVAGVADDAVPDRVPVDGDHGAQGAADLGGVATDAVAAAVAGGGVRIRALDTVGGPAAAVGVPLQYGDATYGAFCVYARTNSEFDDHERAVLTALGRTVATGINTLESRLTLRGTAVIELRFTVVNHPLVDLAERLDCRLAYAGSVADRDRPASLFELSDATGAAVREAAATTEVEVHAVLTEGETGCLIELSVAGAELWTLLADHGADLRDLVVADGTARITVGVARESLARSLAEALTERFADADLVGYSHREERDEPRQAFVARLREDLTERQYAALVRAYSGGFFEWPHETTGDELAAGMGVCRSTFHEHLRAAQRKVFGALLDERPN
ncbi:bacterio-opsin activator domain-containing protein [Haloplanus halophilus]|uniref:bacterio-opsin activator domain-containing protein n=1 Tax=Haloplanus halophilus TaxID=2949993 RepID=UPI00203B1ACA|nr:bacterio-opsin activator domain-containing protein [Haloplanus sp. GDY1]